MSYIDYAQEAENSRKQVKRCYYDARKSAREADKYYAAARSYFKSARFFTQIPHLNKHNEAAALEHTARSFVGLADTCLASSFHSSERARAYAKLARDYDALAIRVITRLEACNG